MLTLGVKRPLPRIRGRVYTVQSGLRARAIDAEELAWTARGARDAAGAVPELDAPGCADRRGTNEFAYAAAADERS